ncbi:MAG: FecR family protein [Brevundimonas sp.]
MTDTSHPVERAALDWLMRVNDPAFDAWDDWQAWLGRDPMNAEIYWRLATAEADLADAMAARVRTPGQRTTGGARRLASRTWFTAAAAAALVAALVGIGWYGLARPQPWLVETAPGEQRALELADGTTIHVAGGTRLRLDRRAPRTVELESGRALFEVAHDDRRPFVVEVGEVAVTDLGTVFDVTRLQDGARVTVSEGVVRVYQRGRAATLNAGDGVIVGDRGFERRPVDPTSVDAWRDGRLVYDNERLDVVAVDLSIALGRPVSVDPDMADRRISGSLSVSGPSETVRRRLKLSLDARVTNDSAGWRIKSRAAP